MLHLERKGMLNPFSLAQRRTVKSLVLLYYLMKRCFMIRLQVWETKDWNLES